MHLVGAPVHSPSGKEDELTEAVVIFEPVVRVSVQVLLIVVHLLL